MLSALIRRRIDRLIDSRGLHVTLPVPINIAAEYEGWEILYRPGIVPLMGFAVYTKRNRIMTINADLIEAWRRYAIGHEMAHIIAGDKGSVFTLYEHEWFRGKQERRADQIAARLLIPEYVLRKSETVDDVARLCVVPRQLVEVRMAEYFPLWGNGGHW